MNVKDEKKNLAEVIFEEELKSYLNYQISKYQS